MGKYKFTDKEKSMIVHSIVEGYREYVAHRKERKEKMKISSAFAYTKGNFIESKVADECGRLGFTYQMSKAGLTWNYLQFTHKDTKRLFLIKNAAYFNEECFAQAKLPTEDGRKGARRSYLEELSKINSELTFSSFNSYQVDGETGKLEYIEQLSFFVSEKRIESELESLKEMCNEFHILTYTIDEAFQISEIRQYLPNPEDNKAYLVDDLSSFISGAELSDEERVVLAPEKDDVIDSEEFDIGIIGEEQMV